MRLGIFLEFWSWVVLGVKGLSLLDELIADIPSFCAGYPLGWMIRTVPRPERKLIPKRDHRMTTVINNRRHALLSVINKVVLINLSFAFINKRPPVGALHWLLSTGSLSRAYLTLFRLQFITSHKVYNESFYRRYLTCSWGYIFVTNRV